MDLRAEWAAGPVEGGLAAALDGEAATGRMRTASRGAAGRQTLRYALLASVMLCPAQPSAETQQYEYVHDDKGRLVEVRLGNGATLAYAYDANGNITSVSTALSAFIFADGFEEATP